MTDLRGERVDEGKVWAACTRCLGREGVMFQHTEQEYQELKERYNDAVDKNAALRARVKVLEEAVEWVCMFLSEERGKELRRIAGREE